MTTPTLHPKFLTGLIVSLGLFTAACGVASVSVSTDDGGNLPIDPDDTASSDDDVQDDDVQDDEGFDDAGDDGDIILGAGPYAVGTLKIVIEHPQADTVTYELACFGDTATLIPSPTEGVRADRACTSLADAEVEQHLVDGPPADQVCTEQFGGPDTARITGMLNGNDIDITIDRSNGCGIDTWDVLLAEVLPQALGNL